MNEETGIPYEPGDHCVFYAVQAANVYFYKQGLIKTERKKYQEERKRRVDIFKALTGVNECRGGGFVLTVPMTLEKLRKYNIAPREIVCAEDSVDVFSSKNFVKRADIKVRGVEGGKTTVDLPALFFIEREAQKEGHVWFCPDENKFDEDYSAHIRKGDSIGFIVPLEKKES